jgi:2-C-methyl-D-erythritol 4-phosphate cytidylyltransferase
MSVVALLLAAGRGERLGSELPKAFVPLAGRALLLHALEALCAAPGVDCVVPVVARGELPRLEALLRAELPRLRAAGREAALADPVVGGAERQDSVRAGLAALPAGAELVAVHDAARALVRPEAVARVVAAARAEGAALLAVPARDTVKRVVAGRSVATPPRAELWTAQTPQVFRVELLREALARAAADGYVGTDDAELVERLGVPVRVVAGDADNLKITHAEDLVVAEALLAARGAAAAGDRAGRPQAAGAAAGGPRLFGGGAGR